MIRIYSVATTPRNFLVSCFAPILHYFYRFCLIHELTPKRKLSLGRQFWWIFFYRQIFFKYFLFSLRRHLFHVKLEQSSNSHFFSKSDLTEKIYLLTVNRAFYLTQPPFSSQIYVRLILFGSNVSIPYDFQLNNKRFWTRLLCSFFFFFYFQSNNNRVYHRVIVFPIFKIRFSLTVRPTKPIVLIVRELESRSLVSECTHVGTRGSFLGSII